MRRSSRIHGLPKQQDRVPHCRVGLARGFRDVWHFPTLEKATLKFCSGSVHFCIKMYSHLACYNVRILHFLFQPFWSQRRFSTTKPVFPRDQRRLWGLPPSCRPSSSGPGRTLRSRSSQIRERLLQHHSTDFTEAELLPRACFDVACMRAALACFVPAGGPCPLDRALTVSLHIARLLYDMFAHSPHRLCALLSPQIRGLLFHGDCIGAR